MKREWPIHGVKWRFAFCHRSKYLGICISHLCGEGVLVLVIDSDSATQQVDAVEVVDGQDGALLVLVLDEAESLYSNGKNTKVLETRKSTSREEGRS